MKNKQLNLEFIRGAAALLVVIGHLKGYTSSSTNYNSHLIQLFVNWGTECVFMFFVLSGIVVHYSFDQKPKTNLTFLKHRVIRLHPTLLLALLISLLVEFYCFKNFPSTNTIIGNFIPYSTMQGHLALLLWDTNPAIWSLTFEVFFYFVFALFIIKKKTINHKMINIWFCLSLISLLFYYNEKANLFFNHLITMLSFSLIWLVGFYIYKFRNKIYTDSSLALVSLSLLPVVSRLHIFPDFYDPVKYTLFSVSAIPLFLLLLIGEKTTKTTKIEKTHIYVMLSTIYLFSIYMIYNDPGYLINIKILYIFFPLFVFICSCISWILNIIKTIASNYIIPTFAYFGKYSYSIYVIHMPIIIYISRTFQINIFSKIFLSLIVIFLISYLMENHVQPYINRRLL